MKTAKGTLFWDIAELLKKFVCCFVCLDFVLKKTSLTMIFHLQCGLYQVSSIPGASPQNIVL